MPAQRKKTKPRTKAQKKPVSKKSTPKRRTIKRQKKSSLKKNVFVVLGVFLLISMVSFGYFLGQNESAQNVETYQKKPVTKNVTEETTKYKKSVPVEKKVVQNKIYPTIKQETIAKNNEIKKDVSKKEVIKKTNVETYKKVVLSSQGNKPKLVIIIDDVHTKTQLNAIQSLGLKITPAIFPPYQLATKTHLLARGLDHYMIHLPMESSSKQFNTQTKTLMTNFTKAQIEKRVKELRSLFPTARYINNHTGSVYTGNYKAMHTLYAALRKEDFLFVDSRTIASSKVRKITRQFGDAYIARDIFIDNEHNIPYIYKQLKQAVNLAKKKGYAVAIGHPHPVTMQALSSANHILMDVELVYIDEIYK